MYEPTNSKIEIPSGDKLILFCPGNRNKLSNSDENLNEIPCANNFRSKLHELNCTKQVTGDLQTTSESCQLGQRQGLVYKAGFAVERKFAELFDICYDSQTASALYTHHQINGKAIRCKCNSYVTFVHFEIKYFIFTHLFYEILLHLFALSIDNIKESDRVGFKINGVPRRAKAEVSYRKQAQIARFKSILGRNQHYFTNSSFLARGHLTPDADFVFSSEQFCTYHFVNVVPTFQTINGGNWNRVENHARQLAQQEQTNLDIYTGTYGQLSLPSSSGDLVPLYLSESEQIEVPEYLWKVVYNPHRSAAIVFITLNNPFAGRSDARELCPDVCAQSGINFSQTARRGFTYCCSYDSFERYIPMHKPLRATHLLTLR